MVKAFYDRIWVTPLESKGSVYVVQKDNQVFVVSKCCGCLVDSKQSFRDYYCSGCGLEFTHQPRDMTTSIWSMNKFVSWSVVPGWISQWTKIPRDDLTVTVDGAIIE